MISTMAAYLTTAEFKLLSTLPSQFVDAVELQQAGFTDAQLDAWSRWIDAQLIKRYAVPFIAPVPAIVLMWLARIVTPKVWSKRGVDPEDAQWQEVKKDDTDARAEIKEAANSETGLYELPLRQLAPEASGSAVVFGSTRGYSEQSPYVWSDQQAQTGMQEDGSGRGSGG